jgi:hypothetical protein
MIIKYIHPDTGFATINSFSDVLLNKSSDDEHKYEITFMCDEIMQGISVYCDSFTLANEYMNQVYNDGKIDFSADSNIVLSVEDFAENSILSDVLLSSLMDTDDDDYDDEEVD